MEKRQHAQRRNVVRGALFMTKDTALTPSLYERQLLAKYIRGVLTIEHVLLLLEEQQQEPIY
ncbi:MAG: hypothetical protein EOO61_18190 [Hymenobacter sp.]|nr:MAG: hypothetical protein EOO61_18190 [Hymenobacter sp.]